MNVDTGQFTAITKQLAALAARVAALEAERLASLAALEITYDAGRQDGEDRTRRGLGLPPRHRDGPAPARPRHLRRVGDLSRGGSQ